MQSIQLKKKIADCDCSSSFLFPVISWFHSFEKYNTPTTRLYNLLIQHVQNALLQHVDHTTRLYNMLIQHANQKINLKNCIRNISIKTMQYFEFPNKRKRKLMKEYWKFCRTGLKGSRYSNLISVLTQLRNMLASSNNYFDSSF